MNLEAERICGYEVSAKMKRIWSMELEILQRFVEVCEEYQLKYWIVDGTLLGAVRHHGFIPWDNDIDVAMPRADFNRLLEIGPFSFRNPLFFQTPVTENSRFFSTYVKIRNENGTAASREEYDLGINCGIFIDIFCLDEIPNSSWNRFWYFWRLAEVSKMRRFALRQPIKKGVLNRVKHLLQLSIYCLFFHNPDASKLFEIYQKEAGRLAGAGCNQIAYHDFGYHENYIWKKKDWDDVVQLDFEGMKLNAPAGFDSILRHEYGDYMQFPKNTETHGYLVFEPDIPYVDFYKK